MAEFEKNCSALDRGVDVNASNAWFMGLLEQHNVEPCLWLCRNVLSAFRNSSMPPSSLFIASKMLHSVLRTHLANAQIVHLLPSHEVLMAAAIGSTTEPSSNAVQTRPSPSRKQLCLCLATLILSEFSRSTSSMQTTLSPLLQQLVNYASQSASNLPFFHLVMAEIPVELRLFASSGANHEQVSKIAHAVVSTVKPLVLSSLAVCLGMSDECAVSSMLECLASWSSCRLSSSTTRDDEQEEDESDGNGSSSVITLSELSQTRTGNSSLWVLLLKRLQEKFAIACVGEDFETAQVAASDCATILQIISELAVFHSPSQAQVNSYNDASQQASFAAACGILQLFFFVVSLWDGIVSQGCLAEWNRALFLGLSTSEDSTSLYSLPRNIGGSSAIGTPLIECLVELTVMLAEHHYLAILGPDEWYARCRETVAANVANEFPLGGRHESLLTDCATAASSLLACLLAALAFPDLSVALGSIEALAYVASLWPSSAQPALESSPGPTLTILIHQLKLPIAVSQARALEFEARTRDGPAAAAAQIKGDEDEEDQESESLWRTLHEMRIESEALLRKLVTQFPGGERIVLLIYSALQQSLEDLKATLGVLADGGAHTLALEQLARKGECLLFIWLSLVEGCMELDLGGLLSETATSPPPSTAHPRFVAAIHMRGGKEAQALHLLQKSIDITEKIVSLNSVQLFPLLHHRCLHLWVLLPDAVGFLGPTSPPTLSPSSSATVPSPCSIEPPLPSEQIDLQPVFRLLCSNSVSSEGFVSLALDALVALTNEGGGLRHLIVPYATFLCDWLSERCALPIAEVPSVPLGPSQLMVAAQAAMSEKVHLCLGRLLSLVPTQDAREARVAATLNSLVGQIELCNRLGADTCSSRTTGSDGLATCARLLAALQGFIRGLSICASAEEDAVSACCNGGMLDSFAPTLFAGLFSMLEALSMSVLSQEDSIAVLAEVSCTPGRRQCLDERYRLTALVGLQASVTSVVCRLLDDYHSQGVLQEALARVRQLIIASLQTSNRCARPPAPCLANLAIVLIRHSSDFDSLLLSPSWDLAAVVLASLQCFSSLNPQVRQFHDPEDCVIYAVECLCLVRQLCATQPTLLFMEHPFDMGEIVCGASESLVSSSLLRAFFNVFQRLLQGFLIGTFEFHANFMRGVNSTLLSLSALPTELQSCLNQTLLQCRPVDLIITLIDGVLLQTRDARIVKHFAIFFETIVLIVNKSEGTLSALLGEACQHLGLTQGANSSTQIAQPLAFYATLFHHLMQSTQQVGKIRSNMTALRKWVAENKHQL